VQKTLGHYNTMNRAPFEQIFDAPQKRLSGEITKKVDARRAAPVIFLLLSGSVITSLWGIESGFKNAVLVGLFLLALLFRKKISQASLLIFLSLWTLLTLYILLGLSNGASEAAITGYLKTWLVYPTIMAFIVLGPFKKYRFELYKLLPIIVILSSSVYIVSLFFVLNGYGAALADSLALTVGESRTGVITISNNASLGLFLMMILMLSLMLAKVLKSSITYWLAFGIGLTIVALTGRRSFLMIFSVIPLIYTLCHCIVSRSMSKRLINLSLWSFIALCAAIGGLLLAQPDVFNLTRNLITSEFSDDSVRSIQGALLIENLKYHPIIGAGIGVNLPADVVRESARPWVVESTYHVLVNNIGLLGVTCIMILYSLVVIRLSALVRGSTNPDAIPLLVVTICLALVSATNPYLTGPEPILIIVIFMLLPDIFETNSQK
jgi:hypothetical protein